MYRYQPLMMRVPIAHLMSSLPPGRIVGLETCHVNNQVAASWGTKALTRGLLCVYGALFETSFELLKVNISKMLKVVVFRLPSNELPFLAAHQ
jgi:hypothetical protein